jgi:hypothetical protein
MLARDEAQLRSLLGPSPAPRQPQHGDRAEHEQVGRNRQQSEKLVISSVVFTRKSPFQLESRHGKDPQLS